MTLIELFEKSKEILSGWVDPEMREAARKELLTVFQEYKAESNFSDIVGPEQKAKWLSELRQTLELIYSLHPMTTGINEEPTLLGDVEKVVLESIALVCSPPVVVKDDDASG